MISCKCENFMFYKRALSFRKFLWCIWDVVHMQWKHIFLDEIMFCSTRENFNVSTCELKFCVLHEGHKVTKKLMHYKTCCMHMTKTFLWHKWKVMCCCMNFINNIFTTLKEEYHTVLLHKKNHLIGNMTGKRRWYWWRTKEHSALHAEWHLRFLLNSL